MSYRDPGHPGGYPPGGANLGFPVILQKHGPKHKILSVLSFHLDVTIQLDVYIEKIKLRKSFLTSLLHWKIALSVVKPNQSARIKITPYQ
jgi:hypothetical protein